MQQQQLLFQCLQFTLSARMNDYGTLFCEQVLELKVLVSIRIMEFNIQNSIKFHCNSIPRRGQQLIETYWTHHPQIALHKHQLNSKLGTIFLNQIPKLQTYKDSWEELACSNNEVMQE